MLTEFFKVYPRTWMAMFWKSSAGDTYHMDLWYLCYTAIAYELGLWLLKIYVHGGGTKSLHSCLGKHKRMQGSPSHHEAPKQFAIKSATYSHAPESTEAVTSLHYHSGSNTIESRCCTNIKRSWTNFELIHVLHSMRTQWKTVGNTGKTRSSWQTISLCHNLTYKQNYSLEGARQLEDKSQQQRHS